MGDSELALIIASLQNFANFASWPQKSRSGEIGQNFEVFLSI